MPSLKSWILELSFLPHWTQKDFPSNFVPFAFVCLNFTPWTLMWEAKLIYAHDIQAKDAHCSCTRASLSSYSSSSSSSQPAQKQPQDVEYNPPCPQILTQIMVTMPSNGSYQQLQKKDPLNLELSTAGSSNLLCIHQRQITETNIKKYVTHHASGL